MKPFVGHQKLGGAVYILPNLITTGNIFFGFFSIIKGLQGDLFWAASAILLAAVFDVLDGRVARLTKSTSEFGVQYDSLCDLVSFGVAPALLMYKGGLYDFGRPGWIICFMFLACGALRLARFNVQSAIGKASGDFIGLPIPMAACLIACFIAFYTDLGNQTFHYFPIIQIQQAMLNEAFKVGFLVVAGVGLALAMVSNVTYRSHKSFKIRGVKPFKLLVILVVMVCFLAFQPEIFGFLFCLLYAISGPAEWLFGWRKAIEEDEIFAPEEEEHLNGEKHNSTSSS